MEAEDWLKSIEKKLEIAQCTDKEKVLFAAHQLFGTADEWWEMYRKCHQDVGSITWNEFKARFRTHYVPRGTLKLKKEFSELQQNGMTVNKYLNKFTQMSRYAPNEVNTDEKK
jgi:predicted PolB exonuclease-like 3'-5' exonuclease